MDPRNHEAGAAAAPPAVPSSPSYGYPTDGNPATGIPATKPGAHWFHKIGEELRKLITDAGLTPTDSNLGQLTQAIAVMIAASVANVAKINVANVFVEDQTIEGASPTLRMSETDAGADLKNAVLTSSSTGVVIASRNDAWDHLLTLFKVTRDGDLTVPGTVEGRDMVADGAKLDALNKASQPETDLGAVDTKYVTPLKLLFGFEILLAANGYIKFPSWMGSPIFQWVRVPGQTIGANSSLEYTATLPVAFQSNNHFSMAGHSDSIITDVDKERVSISSGTLSTQNVFLVNEKTVENSVACRLWIVGV